MSSGKQTKEQIVKITRGKVPESNILAARTLLAFAAVCFAMLIVFKLGLLMSRGLFVDITLIVTPILFIISSVWCILRKGKGIAFQYIFLVLLAVFWFELELMSGYKSKMLLPVLIVLSLRYYNRKFTVFTYFVCVFAILASVWCNAYLYVETEFIDLNIVSFEGVHHVDLSGFIYNSIIDLRPDPQLLFYNGLRLTFAPNFIFLSVITVLAVRFMKYNLANITKAEEIASREANQRAELVDMKTKVMLSQIKPHFIYNTLTTISYFCSEDPEKADELTNRFSEYLRNNLSSLSEVDTIPFTKELDAIKNYLEIEMMRFEDRIHVEYDIQFDNFMVPILSVQPVVENAVKHGICKKEDGGTIRISSFEDCKYYCVAVKDDGVGFDKEAIAFDGKEHVGVKNIITRIENYGGKIAIESQVGVGTTVTIRLPKEREVC